MNKTREDLFIERAIQEYNKNFNPFKSLEWHGIHEIFVLNVSSDRVVDFLRNQLKLAIEEGKRLKEEERAGVEG